LLKISRDRLDYVNPVSKDLLELHSVVAWLSTISTMGKYIIGIPIVLLLVIGLAKAAMNRFKVQEAVTID
jgi:hypothetical protein